MAIRLTIVDPNDPDAEHVRGFVQDRVVIGRARSCDICLPDMAVSTRHLEIKIEGNDYKVVDLGSLNGTYIDGKKLVAYRPKILHNEDVIHAADFKIHFRLGVFPLPMDVGAESTRQARRMVASLLTGSSSRGRLPAILVLGGPGKAGRFEIPPAPSRMMIGRTRDMEIQLEDRDLSRAHAEIIFEAGVIRVNDLGSRNGIVVDGERVETLELESGQSFVVGNTTLALEHPADELLASIQEAPEEETSSFSPDQNGIDTMPPVKAGRDHLPLPLAGEGRDGVEAAPPARQDPTLPLEAGRHHLPVGPEDPLSYPGQPGYRRTTREMIQPPVEPGSDLGLIIIGAIIVVAAVVGLVVLFT